MASYLTLACAGLMAPRVVFRFFAAGDESLSDSLSPPSLSFSLAMCLLDRGAGGGGGGVGRTTGAADLLRELEDVVCRRRFGI